MLETAREGATYSGQVYTWLKEDGTPLNLTGATLSGTLQVEGETTVRAIAGTLAVTGATAGQLTWTYAAGDVAEPGTYLVQFAATFSGKPELSVAEYWIVEPALAWPFNSLAAMRKKLMEKVGATNGSPSLQQYSDAVKEAVLDYGNRRSLKRVVDLSITSGTAGYDLPADFRKLMEIQAVAQPGGVGWSASRKLIAFDQAFEEEHYISGGQIVFVPTPGYSSTRRLWYAARYVADEDGVYQALEKDDIRILLLKGQASLLELKANAVAGNAWRYRDGDVEVDRKDQVKGYQSQVKALNDRYEAAIVAAIGAIGMRG